MKKVVISALTYRRPDGLESLLASLCDLRIPIDIQLSARIIDNEPTPAAQKQVEEWAERIPFPLYYVHEVEAGIAPARNRALLEAYDSDFLVFVDDDETVSPEWIEELWRVQQKSGAHFVQGPVILSVEDPKDEWFIQSKLFDLKRYPDCSSRHEAWSNNVMIDIDFIKTHQIQFDSSLKFDGGSDTLFFQQMHCAGGKGIYAAKAYVYEIQPKKRLNWQWALSRQFRYGNTRAMVAKKQMPTVSAYVNCIARAGACVAYGLLLFPLVIIKGRVGIANSFAYIARGLGVLYGLIGKRYHEYARTIQDSKSGTL